MNVHHGGVHNSVDNSPKPPKERRKYERLFIDKVMLLVFPLEAIIISPPPVPAENSSRSIMC